MKNSIFKKTIAITLLGATTSLMALYSEHASLYKDPRVMGMGGANVAVGSYSTAVFYNPAGLANIKKEHGFVFDFLNIGANGTADIQTFLDDIDGVATDDIAGMTKVLEKYDGTPFHIGVDNYTSLSKNSDGVAWSVGILAATDFNYISHSKQAQIETSSRGYAGVVLGFAKPYETEFGRLDIGISGKYISQQSYEGPIDITDLVSDNIQDTLQKKI